MTDETIEDAGMTSDEAFSEVCEWLSNTIATDDLVRMVRSGESYVNTFAEEFYAQRMNWTDLTDLLDRMAGCKGRSRRCVHRSAMRDAMRFVVGAYQKFPDLAPGKRVEAYQRYQRDRKVESGAVAKKPLPSSMPLFRAPESVLTV